ncbi:hypothetical protein ACE83Q_05080 [Dellaglioa sp. P0083]|uniref:hypothetical protein n=1 Tax=Dellaglioa kimchii TaxID=3344667 RepID=UPI0038D3B8EE
MVDDTEVYNEAYKELPYDVQLLFQEGRLCEKDNDLAVLFDLFIKSTINFTEFYGFNDDRKQLFDEMKQNPEEAAQLIKQYRYYRNWFEKYQANINCFSKLTFLTVCEWYEGQQVYARNN